jgi:hypothetical protein
LVWKFGKEFCCFEMRGGYIVRGLKASCFWFCEELWKGCFVVDFVFCLGVWFGEEVCCCERGSLFFWRYIFGEVNFVG